MHRGREERSDKMGRGGEDDENTDREGHTREQRKEGGSKDGARKAACDEDKSETDNNPVVKERGEIVKGEMLEEWNVGGASKVDQAEGEGEGRRCEAGCGDMGSAGLWKGEI